MPSLNFKKQFAPLVESGTKRQTIRAQRKQPIHVGDDLHLFTGMRTNACRRLRPVEKCTDTQFVQIIALDPQKPDELSVWIGPASLTHKGVEELAKADGFASVHEFLSFFKTTHGLPFEGQLIKW